MNITLDTTSLENASTLFFNLMLTLSVILFMAKQKTFGFAFFVSATVIFCASNSYIEIQKMLEASSIFLGYTMVGLTVYITMGTPWALYKWYKLTSTETKRYVQTKQTLLAKLNKSSLHQLSPVELTSVCSELESEYGLAIPFTVRDKKNKIITWIMVWPLSVVGTFADFIYNTCLKKLLTKIYNQLVTVYANIGMKNSQEYLTDMEKLKLKLAQFELENNTLNPFELH